MLACLLPVRAVTVVNAADFGAVPGSGQDATVPFQRAITAATAAAKPVTLLVPPGRYDFFTTNAHQRACYFSNATESGSNAVRTIALDFTDINDLTVAATGATFMMRGKFTMLVAERCQRFAVRGATFDFAHPTVSEVKAIEKGSNYWIGEVHPDCTYQIQGSSIRWTGDGWSSTHNLVQHYDPVANTTWRGGDPTSGATAILDQGSRRLRFSVPSGALGNVTVGRTYQFRNTYRDQTGMWFSRCREVSLEDVNVRAMAGFGILAQFTENIAFNRLAVAPDPASGRTCATAADILHFSGCKGLVSVRNSVLSAAHDDAVNVHGTHLQIVAKPATNQITVRFKHAQTWGFQAFIAGDDIEFVNPNTLLSFATRKVTAVAFTPGSTDQTLTLDYDNPSGITLNSSVVENITWISAAEFVNCDVSLIPTRGFLLTSRQPIRVEGCRFFRTQMYPILCEDDAKGWFESGPVSDLLLRRNSFYECAEQTVYLNPENTTHAGSVHGNVRIEENDFTLNGSAAVYAKSTAGLTVSGNRFRMRNNTVPTASSLVSSSNTTSLLVAGNTVEAATTPALTVANGNFETPPVAPTGSGTPGSWWTVGEAAALGQGLVAGTPASQVLSIVPAAAAWQLLGPFDPAQGAYLNWSLRQRQRLGPVVASGQLEVGFFAWDGVYDPASGMPSASGMTQLDRPVPITALGSRAQRTARGTLDLTGVPAGTRVWMELHGTGSVAALVDDVSISTASAAAAISYETWAVDEGLTGANAFAAADPDLDRLSNLLEYALDGCDPCSADPMPLAEVKVITGHRAWSFTPRPGASAGLHAQYQLGALINGGWHDVVNGVDGITLAQTSGTWLLDVNTTSNAGVFFRLWSQE